MRDPLKRALPALLILTGASAAAALTPVSFSHGDNARSFVARRVSDHHQPSGEQPNVMSRSSP